jgi:LysR family transcriptional activator of nhaA
VVGEFEDNALLNTFGRRGLGLFFAPSALAQTSPSSSARCWWAMCPSVREQFYAISNDRKIKHPAVEAILASAQKGPCRAPMPERPPPHRHRPACVQTRQKH